MWALIIGAVLITLAAILLFACIDFLEKCPPLSPFIGILFAIGGILILVVSPSIMSKGSKTIYYRPSSIQKNRTNEYTIVSYMKYKKIKEHSDKSFILDKDVVFPFDAFLKKEIVAVAYQGDDFAKLLMIVPEENIVIKNEVGINLYGNCVSGYTRLVVLSDTELANCKIQEKE